MMHCSLAGKRILIVEDEALVAMLLEEVVADCGGSVAAIAASVAEALSAIDAAGSAPIDAVVLDMNLAGETSEPVADHLAERGIPFILATGYGQTNVPERFRALPIISKPFEMAELVRQLAGLPDRR